MEEKRWFTFAEFFAATSCSLAFLSTGAQTVFSGSALSELRRENSSIPVDDTQASWIGGLVPLFYGIGCLFVGQLIDWFGLKKTLLFGTTVTVLGSWALIVWARTVIWLYIARALAGLSVSVTCTTGPLYIAHVASAKARGPLSVMPQFLRAVGLLVSYVAAYFLSWRDLAKFNALLQIPAMVLLFKAPESPIWLVKNEMKERALKTLAWLRNQSPDAVDPGIKEIEDEIRFEPQDGGDEAGSGCRKWFTYEVAFPLFLVLIIHVSFQFSGYSAILFYTNDFFAEAGSTLDPKICAMLVGATFVLTTFLLIPVIGYFSRRFLLLTSIAGICASDVVISVYFYLKEVHYAPLLDSNHTGSDLNGDPRENGELDGFLSDFGWIPLAVTGLIIVFFNLGIGNIVFLLTAEIIPEKLGSKANAAVFTVSGGLWFLSTKTFVDMVSAVGNYGTFAFYCVLEFVSFVILYIYLPETKNRTRLEISSDFQAKKKATIELRRRSLSIIS